MHMFVVVYGFFCFTGMVVETVSDASEIEEIETWESQVQEISVAGGCKKRAGKTHVKGTVNAIVKGVVKKKAV